MSDVHALAADYLKQLKNGGDPFYKEEKIEVEALEMSNLIVLRRDQHPKYFYGFKSCGRPIFTHDTKLARTFESTCMTVKQHVHKLMQIGVNVQPEPTIWREGVLA
jgi:hypothetical protein